MVPEQQEPLERQLETPGVEFRGRLAELIEKFGDPSRCGFVPSLEGYAVAESYLRGDVWIDIHVGIRPSLPNAERSDFCIHMERRGSSADSLFRNDAVHHVGTCERAPDRYGEGGLKLPVLVVVVQAGKRKKSLLATLPTMVDVVRLEPPDDRNISRQGSGEVPKLPVRFSRGRETATSLFEANQLSEVSGITSQREGDPRLLLSSEGRRGRRSATHDRPGNMIQTGPKIEGDISQIEAPVGGYGADCVHKEDHRVTLRVVLNASGKNWLGISLRCEKLDLSLERVGVTYGPAPLEPSTPEVGAEGRCHD